MSAVVIGKEGPWIDVLAEMKLDHLGVRNMAQWVETYRPDCVPDTGIHSVMDLFPHERWERVDGRQDERELTDNELLCELAGRKCYDSFAEKGAKRSNKDYLAHMWEGRVPHRSTGYHAKMTFFFAHISRRVSHELIRNYVGSDRDEEGSPSQESTRFTHHPGVYIAPVRDLDNKFEMREFQQLCDDNYAEYRGYIIRQTEEYEKHTGYKLRGMDRKRVYEAASNMLLHSCGTSFIWTTNPMALAKFFAERDHEAADAEIQRFARKLKLLCLERWPNLFPHVERP